MEIKFTNDYHEAVGLAKIGYEPIECSFGSKGSVVGKLVMDHHGEYSNLEGVAIRAYRDHFGAMADDPRFVVTGKADADACFAIAALAGILPDGLERLAEAVNRVDVDPIGVDLFSSDELTLVKLWSSRSPRREHTAEDFVLGARRWAGLLDSHWREEVGQLQAEEADRKAAAHSAEILFQSDRVVALTCPVWGFDIWYDLAPIVVAFNPNGSNVTVGVKNLDTAVEILGEQGLKPYFVKFGEGWGGRETIGGSPRGEQMSLDDCIRVAKILADAE